MSFPSTTARVAYSGDGSTVEFSVTFPFQANADLAVVTTTAGVDTTQTLNTHYVVGGAGQDSGGTVRFTTAPASGTTITIFRDVDLNQERSFTYNGAFPTATVTLAVDKAMQAAQQLNEKLKRTFRVSETNAEIAPLTVTQRAGKVPGFDATGAPTLYEPELPALPSGAAYDAENIASLKALPIGSIPPNKQIVVAGYYVAGDGGGGVFYYNSASLATDNGGTIIAPTIGSGRWVRAYNGALSVRWFGAKGDGATDDFAPIQAAITASAGSTLHFPQTSSYYKTSSSISILSNTTILGDGPQSIIQTATGDISGLYANGRSGITIRGIHVKSGIAGTTSQVGGIKLSSCGECRIENCTFTGMSWAGVFIDSTSNSSVVGSTFLASLGTLPDSSDICIYRNSNNNVISQNKCYGAAWHGILRQNPDTLTPDVNTNNVISFNQVAGQTAYGITLYTSTQPYNSGIIVYGNIVRNIFGTQLSGASGAGIYAAQVGGTIIQGNQVSDCCKSTTNFGTLAPACIGVASVAGSYPIIISGNSLTSTRGPCISGISNEAQLVISSNTCFSSNSSPGTSSKPILLISTSGAIVSDNNIYQNSSLYYALEVISSDGYTSDRISISCNNINSSDYGIIVDRPGTGTFSNIVISDNVIKNTSAVGMRLARGAGAVVSGNYLSSSGMVLVVDSVANARFSGNRLFSSNSSPSLEINNTCTGSIMGESNSLECKVSNFGTGFIISQYGNTSPSGAITHAVGDRVIQSVPAVGAPKGWRCTVAGSPGTWVSEGNL